MESMKPYFNALLIIGILFLLFGLSQALPFSADSDIWQDIAFHRMVRTYVFAVLGGILIFISIVLRKFSNNLYEEKWDLLNRIRDLEEKYKNISNAK